MISKSFVKLGNLNMIVKNISWIFICFIVNWHVKQINPRSSKSICLPYCTGKMVKLMLTNPVKTMQSQIH